MLGSLMILFGVVLGDVQATDTVESLKRQLLEMQQHMRQLQTRIDKLETHKAEPSTEDRKTPPAQPADNGSLIGKLAIGMTIDTTFAHKDETGGNFSLRAEELAIAASVDPYVRAFASITGSDDGVELEKAAMVTTSLPYGVTGESTRASQSPGSSSLIASGSRPPDDRHRLGATATHRLI